MSILYLLIPIAIIFLILAVCFFFWAIKSGQYDDLESQALKIVIEDNQSSKRSNTVDDSTVIQGSEQATNHTKNQPKNKVE